MSPRLTSRMREELAAAAAESPEFPWLILAPTGEVVAAGPAVVAIAGTEALVAHSLSADSVAKLLALGNDAERLPAETVYHLTDPEGVRHTVFARVARADDHLVVTGRFPHEDERRLLDSYQQMSNELAVLAREHEQQARELRAAIAERDRSYWHLKRIQEVLPICMDCGTVKPDSDWTSVADYLLANKIQLSHGLCPGCLASRREERARR